MPIGRNGFAKAKGTNIDKLLTTIKEEVKNNKECQNNTAKKNNTNKKYIKF